MQTHLSLKRLHVGRTYPDGTREDHHFVNNGSGELILQPVEPDGTDSIPNEPPPLTPPVLSTEPGLEPVNDPPALVLEPVRITDFVNVLECARAASRALDRFIQLRDPSGADLRALERLQAALEPFYPSGKPMTPPTRSIQEVSAMSLSAQAVKLAHRYMGIVNKYENEFDSCGYSAHELELVRTKAHNELIAQLRAEGIDVSDRAATTDLARLVDQWLRD